MPVVTVTTDNNRTKCEIKLEFKLATQKREDMAVTISSGEMFTRPVYGFPSKASLDAMETEPTVCVDTKLEDGSMINHIAVPIGQIDSLIAKLQEFNELYQQNKVHFDSMHKFPRDAK